MTEGESASELAVLRELLFSPDRRRAEELAEKVDALALTPEQLAEQLPEAILRRAGRDDQLARALGPTIESAINESVRDRPGDFADAIFPVLGPAIRKAIAEAMKELVQSINRGMENSFSPRRLRWRLEAIRSGVPYATIVMRRALLYRVEQVFLIHAETGLLLSKASPPDVVTPDADLVSSMLTAIRDFVGDSFDVANAERSAGGLLSFSVGELTVLVEPGPRALIAAVLRGQPTVEFRRELAKTIEDVHALFGSALVRFDGDSKPFTATVPLIERCLVTALETDPEPRSAPVNWRPVLIGVALLLVVGVTWSVRSASRWRTAMRALEATPGLLVVASERSWGTSMIRSLRDPDAASPSAVLASAGADTTAIQQQWQSYLSLDAATTLERASRQLVRPDDVAFTLRGDTVVASGRASIDWVAAAQTRRALPAGVSALDVSGVAPGFPAALQPLVDSLTASRIQFGPGIATPGATGREALAAFASALDRLQSAVRAMGADVRLEVVGRSDESGTDSTNQRLSLLRAEAVARLLAGRPGSREVELTTRGLGTAQPLEAPDESARASVNRSVSFALSVVPHQPRPQ